MGGGGCPPTNTTTATSSGTTSNSAINSSSQVGKLSSLEGTVTTTNTATTTTTTTTRTASKVLDSQQAQQQQQQQQAQQRPWWCRGGMHVNEVGMGLNVVVPPLVLAYTSIDLEHHDDDDDDHFYRKNYLTFVFMVLVLHCVASFVMFGMRTVYCALAVPMYLTSLFFLPTLQYPVVCTVLVIVLAGIKVGVCMSVCFHRYASHHAFKCYSDLTKFGVCVLGCLSNQGGPIWWASQHRLHHKHCDVERDPHSATMDGTEAAFAFFQLHNAVEEEFAPRHIEASFAIRVLDTWSFVVTSLEILAAYELCGRDGLFVAYGSAWLCQMIALWFNVVNHPDNKSGTCKAVDKKYRGASPNWYPAWILLDLVYPLYVTLVGEDEHEVHHTHFALAKRGPYDLAYYITIWPMHQLGLIGDLKGYASE